ncbi:MAG: putative nucleotidyltransferase substrate binding domain-containing protein, partial [Solirubrobacteraceae bacterium]
DAVTVRALEPARPPDGAGLVWAAVGSQAPREPTPGSVRRGALIVAAASSLSQQSLGAAGDALARCGLGGVVRAGDGASWIAAASAGDELARSVLVDRRVLWGTPSDPLPIATGPARERLLGELARVAFAHTPPTGFDADSVLGLDGPRPGLDLRAAAIVPIAGIATWAAFAADEPGGSTPERLQAAARAGVLSAEQATTLAEAFELALELRIVHQLEQLAAGEPIDDRLRAAAMTPLTRARLRDVFRAVSAVAGELR